MHQEPHLKLYDVAIVGGGLVGAVLALILGRLNHSVALIEASPPSTIADHAPDRFLVLTEPSIRFLQQHGVGLDQLQTCFIEQLEISQAGHWGSCAIEASAAGIPYFGAVISHKALQRRLWDLMAQQSNIHCFAPAQLTSLTQENSTVILEIKEGKPQKAQMLRAAWILAADGGNSSARQCLKIPIQTHSYDQTAIVSVVGHRQSSATKGYERFLQKQQGVLALLPWTQQRYAVIWILRETEVQPLLASDDQQWVQHIQQAFGYRAGRLYALEEGMPRWSYPLSSQILEECLHGRVLFIGNAAHQLHPMAAQGFNLSLRDIMRFEQCVRQYPTLELPVMERYLNQSKADQQQTQTWTHQLASSLEIRNPLLPYARSIALSTMNSVLWMQWLLTRWGMGLLRY